MTTAFPVSAAASQDANSDVQSLVNPKVVISVFTNLGSVGVNTATPDGTILFCEIKGV